MSNSVGHGLLLPTVLEHQIKINSNCIGGNTLSRAHAISQLRRFCSSSSRSLLSTDFCGQRLIVRKSTLPRSCLVSGNPLAVLATDPSSKLGGRFKLTGDIEMQVDVKISSVALLETRLLVVLTIYIYIGVVRGIEKGSAYFSAVVLKGLKYSTTKLSEPPL